MTAQIVESYKQGMKIAEISKRYFVSECYVYHYLPKNVRRKNKPKIYHADVISDYKQGLSIKDIMRKYGVSKSNIYVILKGNNIELRKGRK